MIASWDRAANSLAELLDEGVVVLWRPFHEFDGQWFWWGKGGKDNFIKLWQMMYDRYTNEFGLNNLIWVLGYSGEVKTVGILVMTTAILLALIHTIIPQTKKHGPNFRNLQLLLSHSLSMNVVMFLLLKLLKKMNAFGLGL